MGHRDMQRILKFVYNIYGEGGRSLKDPAFDSAYFLKC